MLEAMEYLLQHYHEYRGKVVLYAVVRDTGRTTSLQYKMLNRQINELVGRVNGRFGTAEYCPIRYLKREIEHEELVALYNVAEVAIITSIKEGINLQAMEFIAAQKESCHGVLVYSEFAGYAYCTYSYNIVRSIDIVLGVRHLSKVLFLSIQCILSKLLPVSIPH
jgi:trehalose-6-phosphate synthase